MAHHDLANVALTNRPTKCCLTQNEGDLTKIPLSLSDIDEMTKIPHFIPWLPFSWFPFSSIADVKE